MFYFFNVYFDLICFNLFLYFYLFFQAAFAEKYSLPLCPGQYGFPGLSNLIAAFPDTLAIRGTYLVSQKVVKLVKKSKYFLKFLGRGTKKLICYLREGRRSFSNGTSSRPLNNSFNNSGTSCSTYTSNFGVNPRYLLRRGLSTLKKGNSRVYPYPYPSKGKGRVGYQIFSKGILGQGTLQVQLSRVWKSNYSRVRVKNYSRVRVKPLYISLLYCTLLYTTTLHYFTTVLNQNIS